MDGAKRDLAWAGVTERTRTYRTGPIAAYISNLARRIPQFVWGFPQWPASHEFGSTGHRVPTSLTTPSDAVAIGRRMSTAMTHPSSAMGGIMLQCANA